MRDPVDALLCTLNPVQQAAIEVGEHALLVACPGSGKTRTLVAKALRALRAGKSVVLLTFTREAADEIRGRILRLVSDHEIKRIEVATFHSLCRQTLLS
jgi:superfamily I DNA/RNA helicase